MKKKRVISKTKGSKHDLRGALPKHGAKAKKTGGLLVNVCVFLLALFVMFLLAEAFFRIWGGNDEPVFQDIVQVRADGSRDQGHTKSKPDGVYRILALGDSFTYGKGVGVNDTWPKKLEDKLNGLGIGRFEVINAGLIGGTTQSELRYLRKTGVKFEPDMVILCYFLNDATDRKPQFTYVNPLEGKMQNFSNNKGYSYLLYEIQKALYKREVTSDTVGWYNEQFQHSKNWNSSKKALSGIKELSDEKGFKLVVVTFPFLYELNDDYPFKEIYSQVLAFTHENDIASHDLFPYFKGKQYSKLWVSKDNHHPNADGNEIASSAILDIIVSNGYVNSTRNPAG